jgi:hypothetical protein
MTSLLANAGELPAWCSAVRNCGAVAMLDPIGGRA